MTLDPGTGAPPTPGSPAAPPAADPTPPPPPPPAESAWSAEAAQATEPVARAQVAAVTEPLVAPIAALPAGPSPTIPLPTAPPVYVPTPYPGSAALGVRHDPGPRPVTVTVAVALTFAGIAVAFVGVVLFYLALLDTAAASTSESDTNATGAAVVAFLFGGANLFVAAGIAVPAVFTLRGSNAARIVLCVLCGVCAGWKLMCGGIGLAGISTATSDLADYGMGVAAYSLDLVLLLVALTVLTLLLPASHSYFAKPRKLPGYEGAFHHTVPGHVA
ncbi:MAG: hypothetical protein ACRDT4_16975 [Micromonosporaceae bacterium]